MWALIITTQNDGWQGLFQAAVLEVDPMQLGNKIKAAMAAIEQRHQELPNVVHARDEAQQLTDAAMTLRLLQRTELGESALTRLQSGEGSEGASI
jgi:type II secretory pathway predicted ATPase ExeA